MPTQTLEFWILFKRKQYSCFNIETLTEIIKRSTISYKEVDKVIITLYIFISIIRYDIIYIYCILLIFNRSNVYDSQEQANDQPAGDLIAQACLKTQD